MLQSFFGVAVSPLAALFGIFLTLFPAPPPTAAGRTESARTQIRLEMRLTRTETKAPEPKPGDAKPAASGAAKPTDPAATKTDVLELIGAPVTTTLDGKTASVLVTGGDPSYAISLSPALEKADNTLSGKSAASSEAQIMQIEWIVRLSGKSLPGAASVTVTGASRVQFDRDESLLQVNLRDPRTGRAAMYELTVRAKIVDMADSAAAPRVPEK